MAHTEHVITNGLEPLDPSQHDLLEIAEQTGLDIRLTPMPEALPVVVEPPSKIARVLTACKDGFRRFVEDGGETYIKDPLRSHI